MKYLFSIFSLMLLFNSNAQQTIEGVTLPAKLSSNNQELVLNGGGLREKYFLDLYVSGLYLQSKSSDANSIIKANEAMAIRIEIVSKLISSDKMIEAIEEGMEKSTGGNTAAISKEIEAFKSAFSETISVGDIYNLIYTPNDGFSIYKNGKKVKSISGLKFKQAAFGIWLCDDPADEDLKEGMLGL